MKWPDLSGTRREVSSSSRESVFCFPLGNLRCPSTLRVPAEAGSSHKRCLQSCRELLRGALSELYSSQQRQDCSMLTRETLLFSFSPTLRRTASGSLILSTSTIMSGELQRDADSLLTDNKSTVSVKYTRCRMAVAATLVVRVLDRLFVTFLPSLSSTTPQYV